MHMQVQLTDYINRRTEGLVDSPVGPAILFWLEIWTRKALTQDRTDHFVDDATLQFPIQICCSSTSAEPTSQY